MIDTHPQPRRDTAFAIALWLATVLLGSSAVKEPVIFFAPALTPALTAAWLGLYALAAAALFAQYGTAWLGWLLRYRLLLCVLLFGALASASWAVDPMLALQRSVHLLGSALLAFYAGHALSPSTLLKTLLAAAITLLLLSLLAVFQAPGLGVQAYEGDTVWRGVFANKNTLGFWAGMTIAACVCLFRPTQPLWRSLVLSVGFCLGMVCLFEARSATSLLALLAGLGVAAALLLARRLELGLAQQALLALLGGATAVVAVQVADVDWLNQLLGRSGNLTGRAEVWQQTWALILERPLGGYGYGNLWNPTDASLWIQQRYTDFSWVVYHAHNGALQVASELGLILTAIAALYVLQQTLESLHAHHQRDSDAALFAVVYSVAFLLSNYAEARLLIDRDLFWILYLAMPISLFRQAETEATRVGR